MSPQNLISILGIFLFPFLILWWIKKGGISPVFIHARRKFALQAASLSLFSFLKKGSVEMVFSGLNDFGKMNWLISPKVRWIIFDLFIATDSVLAKENDPKSTILSLNSPFLPEI
jgi:hypothetical protein